MRLFLLSQSKPKKSHLLLKGIQNARPCLHPHVFQKRARHLSTYTVVFNTLRQTNAKHIISLSGSPWARISSVRFLSRIALVAHSNSFALLDCSTGSYQSVDTFVSSLLHSTATFPQFVLSILCLQALFAVHEVSCSFFPYLLSLLLFAKLILLTLFGSSYRLAALHSNYRLLQSSNFVFSAYLIRVTFFWHSCFFI